MSFQWCRMRAWWLLALLGCSSAVRGTAASRWLMQDPATYVSVRGHQPIGVYAIGDQGAAVTIGSGIGIRYLADRHAQVSVASDLLPGGRAVSMTPNAAAKSGVASDSTTVLGVQVTAATVLDARAVSGSGTSFTADDSGGNGANYAVSYNIAAFKPTTTRNEFSSTAFTDRAARSAATSGFGNGPVALAWSFETAAFARADRDMPVRVGRHQKHWDDRRRLLASGRA